MSNPRISVFRDGTGRGLVAEEALSALRRSPGELAEALRLVTGVQEYDQPLTSGLNRRTPSPMTSASSTRGRLMAEA
jgi:hypothetical protein